MDKAKRQETITRRGFLTILASTGFVGVLFRSVFWGGCTMRRPVTPTTAQSSHAVHPDRVRLAAAGMGVNARPWRKMRQ